MSISSLITKATSGALRAVAKAPASGAPPVSLSTPHFVALGKLLSGLPVSAILAIIANHATVDSDIDLAEKTAGLIAMAFPPGALVASDAQMAISALKFLIDAAGIGATPIHVSGGVPAWYPPGGGPGSFRGR